MIAEQAISRGAYYNGSKCLLLFLSFNEGLKGRGSERELEKQIVRSVMTTITECSLQDPIRKTGYSFTFPLLMPIRGGQSLPFLTRGVLAVSWGSAGSFGSGGSFLITDKGNTIHFRGQMG